MRSKFHLAVAAMVATVTASMLLGVGMVDAQVKKGKTRPMATAQLMKGTVKPQCEALKKGLDTPPTADEQWQDLLLHASLLNEASYTLMDDGRCPDGTWATAASKTLRDGSAAVIKALEAKDAAAAKTAFGDMTKSCKGCHEVHKPKK